MTRRAEQKYLRRVVSDDAGHGIQNRRRLIVRTGTRVKSLVAILFALALTVPVSARIEPYSSLQIDPTQLCIIRQNGIRVGEIFVPDQERGAINYVEHWVLYDNYVYPNIDKPSLVTTIEAVRNDYESEDDFFARVPWGKGFRYVRVDCTDTDKLPGR